MAEWARLYYIDRGEGEVSDTLSDIAGGPLGQLRLLSGALGRLRREWSTNSSLYLCLPPRIKLSVDGCLDVLTAAKTSLQGLPRLCTIIPLAASVNRVLNRTLVCAMGDELCLRGKLAFMSGSPFAAPITCQSGCEVPSSSSTSLLRLFSYRSTFFAISLSFLNGSRIAIQK